MLYKKSLLQISHFFLFCLIFMMNVNGNNFFHLKELFFILFVSSSLKYGNYKKIFNFLLMIVLYLYSAVVNLFTEPAYQFNAAVYNLLGFIYLFLQVYEIPEYKNTIIKSFLASAFVVAFMSIIFWIICMSSPIIATGLQLFFETNKTDAAAFIFMIVEREILGFKFLRVYYCTAPCMICALGYYLLQMLNNKKIKYFLLVLIFDFALLISGARANILVVALLNGGYFCLKLIKQKKLVRAFIIIMIAGAFALFFLLTLMGEKSDSSIKVKDLHKVSYFKIFSEHPYKTIFTGWGAVSEFYSRGFHKMTNTTELSFFDTIRRYGVLSTILIFTFIWFRPVIYCFTNKMPLAYQLFFSVMVISYVCVACTNPFLLGSIGFCSLIFLETIIQDYYHKFQWRRKNAIC